MYRLSCLLLLAAGLLAAPDAQAQRVAFAARASTLGPGLEVALPVASGFNARLGGHFFSYSHSQTLTDLEINVRADADARLASVSALIDWMPFRGDFRLSGGLALNLNQVEALVTPLEPYTIEGKTFQPERIGTLTARVQHGSPVSPYLGIGFGDAVRAGRRVAFVFDLGVLYTGSPSIEMEGEGMIAPTVAQAATLEAGFQSFRLYPVLSLGVSVAL